MVTHLFNAMSQIGNREPGLAGAAIDIGTLSAGLIADGIHVDPGDDRRSRCAPSAGPAKIFLVTDAMATIGTDMTSFTLNGRTIYRKDGSLTAGRRHAGRRRSRHDLGRALHASHVGLDLGEALRMASLYPAEAMGVDAPPRAAGAKARPPTSCISPTVWTCARSGSAANVSSRLEGAPTFRPSAGLRASTPAPRRSRARPSASPCR